MGIRRSFSQRSESHVKTRLTAALAAAAILLVAFAAVATAATSTGKIYKFKYNAASQTGKLTTISGKKKVKKSFALSKETLCGVSYGQSGDEIPCKTLGAKKYKGKKVRVTTGKNEAGKKITAVISVDMTKR